MFRPAYNASGHRVYFGCDRDEVELAEPGSRAERAVLITICCKSGAAGLLSGFSAT